MEYQGWDKILMITLISGKKIGVYKIMRNTVYVNWMMLTEGTNIQSLPKKKNNHSLLTNIC